MTGDPERIVRNHLNSAIITTFCQTELKHEAVKELEESLEAALGSDTEGLPFKPITGQDTMQAVNSSISDPSSVLKLWNALRKMAREETNGSLR